MFNQDSGRGLFETRKVGVLRSIRLSGTKAANFTVGKLLAVKTLQFREHRRLRFRTDLLGLRSHHTAPLGAASRTQKTGEAAWVGPRRLIFFAQAMLVALFERRAAASASDFVDRRIFVEEFHAVREFFGVRFRHLTDERGVASQVFEREQFLTQGTDSTCFHVLVADEPFEQILDEFFAGMALAVFQFDPSGRGYEAL
jgi:hypothetical protein